ncbi:Glycosyltransferase family 4 protein [Deinococcus saxicola]
MLVVSLNKPDSAMVKLLGATGVRVDRIENSSILRSALNLKRVLKDYSADLVVANSFRCYLVAKIATAGSGKPVAYWIHTINQIYTSHVRKFLFPLLSKRDALLYVSKAVRENNRPRGYQGQDAVIYNSVEGPEMMQEWQPYNPDKRAELGIPDDAIVLGYTAHFVYYKDHPTLLNAFDTLSQRFPKLYLVLVGEGADRKVEVARAEKFAARDRILFLGRRRDARALLGIVDLYVHVASEEAFGLSVVEAMLAKRPVIAARAFALPELIQDGKTGLLFESGNVQELERQITRLIEDRAYAAQLAAAGEQDCRRRFPPGPFAEQVTVFLRKVGSTRLPPAKKW